MKIELTTNEVAALRNVLTDAVINEKSPTKCNTLKALDNLLMTGDRWKGLWKLEDINS